MIFLKPKFAQKTNDAIIKPKLQKPNRSKVIQSKVIEKPGKNIRKKIY